MTIVYNNKKIIKITNENYFVVKKKKKQNGIPLFLIPIAARKEYSLLKIRVISVL